MKEKLRKEFDFVIMLPCPNSFFEDMIKNWSWLNSLKIQELKSTRESCKSNSFSVRFRYYLNNISHFSEFDSANNLKGQ